MADRLSKSLPSGAHTGPPHIHVTDAGSVSLNAVLDRMAGFLALLSPDGTIVDMSAATLNAAGFSRDDVIGVKFWETPFWKGHPEAQEAVRSAVLEAAADRPSHGEWAYFTADGSERFAVRSVTPIYDDQRNVRMVIAEGHDITDRVHAERDLAEREQRMYRIVHHAPEAIVILDCDTGRFMDANKNAQRLFGRTREEMKQVGPLETSPARQPNGRDSQEYAHELLAMALKGQMPEFEWTHSTGQGKEFICTVRLVQLPSMGERTLCGSITDITARKRMEAIVRGHNQLLERLARDASLEEVLTLLAETIEAQFPGIRCSILTLDHEHHCLRHGAAPNLPEFYNKAIDGVEIGPKVGSCGAAAYLGQRVVVADVQCHENWAPYLELAEKADVRACWSQPIISSQNKVLGTFAMYYSEVREPTDIELEVIETAAQHASIAIERRQADQKLDAMHRDLEQRVQRRTADLEEANRNLRRSNRDLEKFAYAASHDLREPLRALSGFSDLLRTRYEQQMDDRADEYLLHISQGASRMHELLDGLLAYSRVGSADESFEEVDSGLALDEALANLSSALKSSAAVVHREPLPRVVADYSQLVHLFQYLISNAIKFRGDQIPEITISSLRVDRLWQIQIRDNGIGIEPAYCKKVFEIFDRLHTRDEYPGLGIGLALCKRIVDRHGGDIWVESTPGVGSTFTFALPVA